MKRLLFVDDEPRILEALERMLFALSDDWEMNFVASGREATQLLGEENYDVLVTDMRMPLMDGAELLTWAKENRPGVVRVVLSGYAEEQLALRAVPVAHQFLNKPCTAAELRAVVERACRLRELLEAEELQLAVGRVESLPARPSVFQQLTTALADPDASLRDVGKIVNQDPAIAAKVLQLVNTAFFGLPRAVSCIDRAVAFLGFSMVRTLVLAVETFASFAGAGDVLDLEAEQRHSLGVAHLARALCDDTTQQEDAFMAGLLHDVGRLVLAQEAPERLAGVAAARRDGDQRPLYAIEQDHGIPHADIGAYLLGIWGLPYPIVEAVAFHHSPEVLEEPRFGLLGAVHVADALLRDVSDDALRPTLTAWGVDGQLDAWRCLAGNFEELPS